MHRSSASGWHSCGVGLLLLAAVVLTGGCLELLPLSDQADLTILVDTPDQIVPVSEAVGRYENETGIRVRVAAPDDACREGGGCPGDLLVADCSRIADYAAWGSLIPLNDYLGNGTSLNWTSFERPTLIMAGEYPDRSGEIFALPYSPDALGIVYRADLLQDPGIITAFCQTYGYPAGIPGSYDELSDLAGFFTGYQPGMSGIGFAGTDGAQPGSSPWCSLVSSYGARVLPVDENPESMAWNSSKTRSAISMLKNLSYFAPPGVEKFGDREVIDAFSSGTSAIAITWFSRFPEILAATGGRNMTAGFVPLPGEVTGGESNRGITVRMQGIGIVRGGDTTAAERFLGWIYSPPVQLALAESGYQPSRVQVLDSYEYLSMNPYNRGFPESVRMGVLVGKGVSSEGIREICEETITACLAPGINGSPAQEQAVLDKSAIQIGMMAGKA